ncbi:MAG: hypothetical protein JXA73_21465 [Acidobacteria bacterium]|nr:hypothetical protein [Acidobacteriota bacterium]
MEILIGNSHKRDGIKLLESNMQARQILLWGIVKRPLESWKEKYCMD